MEILIKQLPTSMNSRRLVTELHFNKRVLTLFFKAQRARAINEETYKPLWFEPNDDEFTKRKMFKTTGKYFEAKQTRFEQQKKENAFIPIFKVSINS